MKTNKVKVYLTILASCIIVVLASCTLDNDVLLDSRQIQQTLNIRLSATKGSFGDLGNTRSGISGTGWEDGEIIYIDFETQQAVLIFSATAVYDAANSDWVVTVTEDNRNEPWVKDDPGLKDGIYYVRAYYFEHPIATDAISATLEPATCIYFAYTGTYEFDADGSLNLTLNLTPFCGRIRFKGNPGTIITIEEGITTYQSFNRSYSSAPKEYSGPFTIKVGSDGYTPYVYGELSDLRNCTLKVSIGNKLYTKKCGESILKRKESGWMHLPSETALNGWEMTNSPARTLHFTISGNGQTAEFIVRLVEKGTFQMGQSADGNNETPVHTVTLTKNYYMGETEVTQGLWYAVMGQKPTSDGSSWNSSFGLGDNYPAYYISYEDCEQFLTKLSQMTGQNFRFPTEAEWEFAAKGGNKSKGYTYAGSNTIGDVAWYTVNSCDKGSSSPDYGAHVVKTKAANELGLYDMSGNVYEWCYDWYGSYSSSAQTDPTGPTSGSDRVDRGGSWFISATICRCAYRHGYSPTIRLNLMGFRLAL